MDFTSLTPQQVLDLGKPTPEYAEVLKATKGPKIDWSDPRKGLALLRHYSGSALIPEETDPEVLEESFDVAARDGFSLPVKSFRPAKRGDAAGGALIVLYFAGAFVAGDIGTLARTARQLVKEFDAVVVTPTYRLAPEYPFPYGINDGWDTFEWIAQNATTKLHADPTAGFIIGGVSSGSSIAAVIAHLARDNDTQPHLTGTWLCCGGIRLAPDQRDELPAHYRERFLSRTQDECVNSLLSSGEQGKFTRAALAPDENSKLYAPLIWPTELGHKGLPKTYSQVCGIDQPRDESLIFDDMLKREGTPTRLDLYAGLPHVFFVMFRDLPQSKEWEQRTMDGFAWLLQN